MCSVSPQKTQAGCQLDFFLSLVKVPLIVSESVRRNVVKLVGDYRRGGHACTPYLADQYSVLSIIWGSRDPHGESPRSQWSLGSVAFGLLLCLGKI